HALSYLIGICSVSFFFFFSSRRRHTRLVSDWSSDVCSSDLNWNTASSGMTNWDLRAFAVDPTSPSTVYAGTGGGGVFKTTNGGRSEERRVGKECRSRRAPNH